jgi:hypothetical protein
MHPHPKVSLAYFVMVYSVPRCHLILCLPKIKLRVKEPLSHIQNHTALKVSQASTTSCSDAQAPLLETPQEGVPKVRKPKKIVNHLKEYFDKKDTSEC